MSTDKIFQKLINTLYPAQRRELGVLFGMMVISMALETLGVGMMLPVLVLISEPNIGAKYPEVQPLLGALGNPSQVQLIIGGMLVLGAFFGFKNSFLAYMVWRKVSFITNAWASLSQRLFTGYLYQPFTFHLQRNSAQLIRNTNYETMQFISGLSSVIELLTHGLVLFGVTMLLLWVEPVGGLVIFVMFGIAGILFHSLTKSKLSSWGRARQFHDGKRIQHLQQGLGGAKDVKLLGREEAFLEQYAIHNTRSAQIERKRSFLNALPRLWFELLAVFGLVALVVGMLLQGKLIETLVPTVGLFAAAAFRLLPNIGSVQLHAQTVRFVGPVIDSLYEELSLFDDVQQAHDAVPIPFCHEIQLNNLSFTYEGSERATLKDINLHIPIGTMVGFVGGSGAGKSTLIDVILGLLPPNKGQVIVDGKDIRSNLRGWQDQMGYVPQSIFLTDDSLRSNIAFGLPEVQINDHALWAAIKAAQLGEFINSLPEGLNTIVGERGIRLSGGQRQRIGIARALYHDPNVLVLDEATSALDIATEQEVMQAITAMQGNKTIIIIAHRLPTVSSCDKIYRMDQGRIVQEGFVNEVVNL